MRKISLEYLAGLVDGDGCIDLSTSKYKYPQIRIVLVKEDGDVLFRLKEQYGGNICERNTRSIKAHKSNWRDQYCWSIVGEKCSILLKELVPHLIIKKHRALNVLNTSKQYN